jgi:SAM-dependent methyltransferase
MSMMDSTLIPPHVARKLARYCERFEGETTPEMQGRWRTWLEEICTASAEARSRPRRRFSEPDALEVRQRLAAAYLRGEGIEIGALHNPLPLPPEAAARYVDLCDEEELRLLYYEIADYEFVDVDIVDDGETLSTMDAGSQDFVISNHFLEHCHDPLGALVSHARVLRTGGVLYCAIPDCRRTFDSERERTSFEHLWRDHREGTDWSRQGHFQEWSAKVNHRTGAEHEAWWRMLDALDYSIHFHVWAPWDMLDFLAQARRRLEFPMGLREVVVHSNECVIVLEKE